VTGREQTDAIEFTLSGTKTRDLTRTKCVRLAMLRAFPLPASGAFTDLLAAIDARPTGEGSTDVEFSVLVER
jgi:hypothetical protein